MPVKKDASGRRSVQAEVEVPGTPEEVWQAIATGPGISSWFMPAEVEECEGGAVVFHIGPGMETSGHVTLWQPPHRFAYEETDWYGDAPPLATEFVIEARAGGSCRVRLVHSLFASGEDWDDQLESMERGWPPFFKVLRLYLRHFAGMRSAIIRSMGGHPGSETAAWADVTQALGLAGATVGERRESLAKSAPQLAGLVESISQDSDHREVLLRLEKPMPGVALVGAFTWAGQVQVAVSLYLYGEEASTVAAREKPRWQAWMDETFPQPGEANDGG